MVAIFCTIFIVLSMRSTFLSLPNLNQAIFLPLDGGGGVGGGEDFLIWPISGVCATLEGMVFKLLSLKQDIQFLLF